MDKGSVGPFPGLGRLGRSDGTCRFLLNPCRDVITLLLEGGLAHTGAATRGNSCSLFSLQQCVKHPFDRHAPLPAGQLKFDSKMHHMALFEAGGKGNTLEKKATTQLIYSVSFN